MADLDRVAGARMKPVRRTFPRLTGEQYEKVRAALLNKELGRFAFVAPDDEGGMRCAVGELAHAAGVPDEILAVAGTDVPEREAVASETAHCFAIMLDALRTAYGLDAEQVETIIDANDSMLFGDARALDVIRLVAEWTA